MKKWIFPLLFIGVSLGTLFVNFFGLDIVRQSGVFSNDYLMKISSIEFDMNSMMRYIAGARIKELALVILLMLTPSSGFLMKLLVFAWAFINGMLASVCVIQQSIMGFVAFVIISLPSYMIFYPGMLFLANIVRAYKVKNIFISLFLGLILILSCSLFETYFFAFFIKNMLHMI